MKIERKNKRMLKTLSLVLIMALTIITAGCGQSAKSPSDTVDTYLQAVKDKNSEAIKEVYSGNDLESEVESDNNLIGSAIKDKMLEFEYEIKDETINGNTATVTVSLKTYEIGAAVIKALFDMSEAAQSGDVGEYTDYLNKEIEACEFGFEADATIQLSNVDGKWMIDQFAEKGEFMNAMTGNLYQYIDEISSIYNVD